MAAIYSGTNTTFQNSIVSNDESGGNCDTIDNGITSNGFNLSSDTTCAFNKVGDVVVEMKTKTEPSADPERILIIFDGQRWWIRHVYLIEHKLDFNRMVYHCDRSLGGPFGSVEEAVAPAKEMLHGIRNRPSTRSA